MMKKLMYIMLCVGLGLVLCETAIASPAIDSAIIKTRIWNDNPTSIVTTINSYPSLISIKDEQIVAGGWGNLHNFRLSDDGGSTPATFVNGDAFCFAADVTITGTGNAEAGLMIAPWWSLDADGKFMINGASGEIACFGGRLPFYTFTGNHGITYTKGDTVRMGVVYRPNSNSEEDPATIEYSVTMAATTYCSGALPFDQGNPAEDPPHGLWGMLTPAQVGGYFQPQVWEAGKWEQATFEDMVYVAGDLCCICTDDVEVLVDIKPESCPNPMPVKGEGVIKAAILGSCTLDVTDIDAASITLGGAPAIRSKIQDVGGPAAVQLDSMDDIAARPWTDLRGPGWLYQASGAMGIDYGVTGVTPNPLSGWDYLGNFVGVGAPMGAWGDPAICDYWWTDWCNQYYGSFDREISGPFSPLELGILGTDDTILLDVYKTIANSPEHVREIQLYDSLGGRNTYSVQAEATAVNVGAGWKTYAVCLSNALENNADLSDIVDIRLFVSSWSFAPNYDGAPWPEYTGGRPTGTPVLIDDLRLVRAHDPQCGDCLTGADGFDDLVLKFNRADIVPGLGPVHHGDVVDLTLTGDLLDGCKRIVGSDCVDIVGKADPSQRPPKK